MNENKYSETIKKQNSEYIKISELKISDNKIDCKLNLSPNISNYFNGNHLIVEYDINIEDVDESILAIPFISAVITVAWAVGADLYVDKLDEIYLKSIDTVKTVYEKWYPQFSFSTQIHVKEIIHNKLINEGHALLFSGGVDSIASYLRHKDKKPSLISIWGADIPTSEYEFWGTVKNRLISFAKEDGVDNYFIKTNAREFINDAILAKKYEIEEGWWGQVCHGLLLLGLCAPLSKKSINSIIISSSYTKDFKKPWGSHPLIDSNISWANVKVDHDAYELSRQDKLECVLRNNPTYLPHIRVCHAQHSEYNCGICEKCLRTITGLVLADIDPKECNFYINDGIFDLITNYFLEGLIPWGNDPFFFWLDIQKHIPNNQDGNDMYNSNQFFEWFKGFDLSNYEYKGNNKLTQLFIFYYLAKYKGISHTAKRVSKYISRKIKLTKIG